MLTVDWLSGHLVPLHRKHRQVILDQGSLTRKLVRSSDNNFSIDLVSAKFVKATREESLHMGLRTRELSYVREVVLNCYSHPCVYARTVIPASKLIGELRRVRYLKSQSIGGLLFSLKNLEFGQFEICRFLLDDIRVIGRRRSFLTSNSKVLVSEFFLPFAFEVLVNSNLGS